MHDLETLVGLANACFRQGRYAQALAQYSRALTQNPDHPGLLNNRAATLEKLGRLDEALASYERVQRHMPGHSGVLNNIGLVLMKLQRLDEALDWLDRAVRLDPLYAEAFNNRGNVLSKLRRFKEAVASYDRALELRPDHATSLVNRALVLHDLKQYRAAGAAFAEVLRRDPAAFPPVHQHLFVSRLRCCDWSDHAAAVADIIRRVEEGEPPVDPFYLLAIAERAETQRIPTQTFAAQFRAPMPMPLPRPTARASSRIHVAYVCADFGARHAVWYLTEGLFRGHDRSRFRTTGVSLGVMPDATVHAQFDDWIDATHLGDADLAGLLRQRRVDIAVDLQGFTSDCRPAIFAHRAAPIQISWLAYPGTTGLPAMDYIIADRHVIPPAYERFYSENVIRLPDSYQANNHRQHPIERPTGRAENGLPETGFVFCCLNNNYKIGPDLFDIWMGLLREIDGSVLWLLGDTDDAIANLRREAERRGVAGTRLVFAARIGGPAHLARHGAADLFLDTLPYNAHTTATDALWAGLPVLTCPGETFASRVAGSLLHAAGLPELVMGSLADYRRTAHDLATQPDRLQGLKSKLQAARPTCRLFDLDCFRQNLETAYVLAHRRHSRGLPPIGFDVPEGGAPAGDSAPDAQ